MSSKVYKIINSLQKRLSEISSNENVTTVITKQGILFGFSPSSSSNSYCLGCCTTAEDIPPGNVLIGAFFLGQQDEAKITEFCSDISKDKKSGKLLVWQLPSEQEQAKLFDIKSKKLTECSTFELNAPFQEAEEFLVQINVEFTFPLKFKWSNDAAFEDLNLDEMVENVANETFRLERSSFVIDSGNVSNILVEDVYNQIEQFDELLDVQIPANMKKKMIEKSQKQLKSQRTPLRFKSGADSADEIAGEIVLEPGKSYELQYALTVCLNVQLQNNIQQLQKAMQNALKRTLLQLKQCFESVDHQKINNPWPVPKVLNFYDQEMFGHVITAVFYGLNCPELYKQQRQLLHCKYFVPTTRPTFKLANCLTRKQKNFYAGKKLMNVHQGLSSGIKNGQCAIVKRRYIYFHYNQDGFDDAGWGCAYRSLQTIISWFMVQGYVDIDQVPTHRQIQQALIDCGDKPANFLGTSKWIGSQEVCYVLSHLYGIQSKIIFINSANELNDKARDLIKHFQTNGTPVMIGGGVLAHTIIGVDFDETTGNVKYLVLDPHYVGEEDLGQIHKKSGCAWKPVTFWDKNSFYNLCLPQVPNDF